MKAQLFLLTALTLACTGCGGSGGGMSTSPSGSGAGLPAGSYSTPSNDSRLLAFTVSPTGVVTNAAINTGGLLTFNGGTGDETSNGDITLAFSQLKADCRVSRSGPGGAYIANVTAQFSNGEVENMAVTLDPSGG